MGTRYLHPCDRSEAGMQARKLDNEIDRKCAAHFEHTIAVGAGEADILSSFKFIEEVLGDKAI